MYVYKIPSIDPMRNLAIEEVCFKYWDKREPLLLIWQNRDAIVLGKHQNPHEEINMAYIKEHKIPVLRRISGGGTVYHDMGNVNYSLIYGQSKDMPLDVDELSQILVKGFQAIGIEIEVSKRHDLRLNDKKISGTAQARSGPQILHHGTLLFDSNLPKLRKALKVNHHKITSKSVQSVPSSVTNISTVLPEIRDVNEFVDRLIYGIGQSESLKEWTLPAILQPEVSTLIRDKYSQWSWNYGRSKQYCFEISHSFLWGHLQARIGLNKGCAESVLLTSEVLPQKVLRMMEACMTGCPYEEHLIEQALSNLGIKEIVETPIESLVSFLAGH